MSDPLAFSCRILTEPGDILGMFVTFLDILEDGREDGFSLASSRLERNPQPPERSLQQLSSCKSLIADFIDSWIECGVSFNVEYILEGGGFF